MHEIKYFLILHHFPYNHNKYSITLKYFYMISIKDVLISEASNGPSGESESFSKEKNVFHP